MTEAVVSATRWAVRLHVLAVVACSDGQAVDGALGTRLCASMVGMAAAVSGWHNPPELIVQCLASLACRAMPMVRLGGTTRGRPCSC